MISLISSVAVQEFLGEVRKKKKHYIDTGIIVLPDLFSGNYRNELFDHRKTKETIGNKLKDIFEDQWVKLDIGIIKRDRLQSFLQQKSLPPLKGFLSSEFVPIARVHKLAHSNPGKSTAEQPKEGVLFDQQFFNQKMEEMVEKIIQAVQHNIEHQGKTASRIKLPGVSPEIIYDQTAYRQFVQELAPYVDRIKEALKIDARNEIMGTIDYYIKRDDGGILKIDIITNHAFDLFNTTFRHMAKSLKHPDELEGLKNEFKTKRNTFLRQQNGFLKQIEARMLEDDFFLGRNKEERQTESFAIPDDVLELFQEFPDLQKRFFKTTAEKIAMVLTSNNVTKNDVTLYYNITESEDGKQTFDIRFGSIENFRITRGLRKYNGLATHIPLDDDAHKALEKASREKEKLFAAAEAIESLNELERLEKIILHLQALKVKFPALSIDLHPLMDKQSRLRKEKTLLDAEAKEYQELVDAIDELLADPSRMQEELVHFSVEPEEDALPSGLQIAPKRRERNLQDFMRQLAKVITKRQPTALAELKHYDDLDLKAIPSVIFSILKDLFIKHALEEAPEKKIEELRERLKKDTRLKETLEKLAEQYAATYKSIITDAFVNRFFSIAADVVKVTKIPKILEEMVEGTTKYRPIFETETGHVTHRGDQVVMRVKEAMKRKDENLQKWREKIISLDEKVASIQIDEQAYQQSRELTESQLKRFSPAQITDIVMNKDGKFTMEKRTLAWLESKYVTLLLQTLIQAKDSQKMEQRKAALNGAINYMRSLEENNQPDFLKAKLSSHMNQLKHYTTDLNSVHEHFDTENNTPLEAYDSDLKKMKEAFVKNFCQPRK